jgi:hypothetical protein
MSKFIAQRTSTWRPSKEWRPCTFDGTIIPYSGMSELHVHLAGKNEKGHRIDVHFGKGSEVFFGKMDDRSYTPETLLLAAKRIHANFTKSGNKTGHDYIGLV